MLTQVIKLTADATGFQKGAAQAANMTKNAFANVGRDITGRLAGAFTAAALIDKVIGFGHSIIEAADHVGDLSDNLELSVEEVQRLGVAAQLAGTKFGKMESVIRKVQAFRDQVLSGDEAALKKASAMGINPAGMSPLELIREMVAAAEKSKAASGAVADVFKANFTTVKNVLEKLQNMGPIEMFKQEDIDKIGQAKDAFDEMARVLKVSFAPALIFAIDAITGLVMSLREMSTLIAETVMGIPESERTKINKERMLANLESLGLAGASSEAFRYRNEAVSRDKSIPPPDVKNQENALAKAALPMVPSADALARIGLFVGGAGRDASQSLVSIGNYQLHELRRIRNVLEDAHR